MFGVALFIDANYLGVRDVWRDSFRSPPRGESRQAERAGLRQRECRMPRGSCRPGRVVFLFEMMVYGSVEFVDGDVSSVKKWLVGERGQRMAWALRLR